MKSLYVYGIVAAEAGLPAHAGIEGAPLSLVKGDGVAALVSDLSGEELRLGRESLTAHARVLEEAHSLGTVLPMQFGIVMEDAEAVRGRLLEEHHDLLVSQLEDFEGKSEVRLRGTYQQEAVLREIVREDRAVARLRAAIEHVPEDAAYYDRIRLGELVAAALQRRREQDAGRIMQALVPLSLAHELADPGHEQMALNASFLIEDERLSEFDEAVEGVGEVYAGRIKFKYTGPLPAHSFARALAEA